MKKTILVIAEKQEETFYRAVFRDKEQLHFRHMNAHLSIDPLPDLIIIDSGFDSHRGLLLLHNLKKEAPSIPVIFVADSSTDAAAVAAFRNGARDFFSKPVNCLELKERSERIVRIKQASTETRVPLEQGREATFVGPESRMTSDTPPHLLRAVSLMETRLTENLSLEQLAREAGMSRYHFCREFRKSIGLTPMALLLHLRIERAKELLRKGKTVSSTCLESGFNDLSNFIRSFKRATSLTPGEFRFRNRRQQGPPLQPPPINRTSSTTSSNPR